MIEWTVCGCVCVCRCVCVGRCIGWAVQVESEKRVARMISSLAALVGIAHAGSLLLRSSCPVLPFACGRTGQPPRHVSSWVACWFRLYQITTIDYACPRSTLCPVTSLLLPCSGLLPNPQWAASVLCCPVVSFRVLALYITVCARVGLHNAPFSACSWRFSCSCCCCSSASCCSCCCCLCWWRWWCCCRRQRWRCLCRWRMKINIY